VALGHGIVVAALATVATPTVPVAAGPMMITVKPNALASNPQLATRTPMRVRMTVIAHPFRRGAYMSRELVLLVRGRR
jgi:hypothetical protein